MIKKHGGLMLKVSRAAPKTGWRHTVIQKKERSTLSYVPGHRRQSYYHGTADMKPTAVLAAVGFVVSILPVKYQYECEEVNHV